jgi:penicillin amidase
VKAARRAAWLLAATAVAAALSLWVALRASLPLLDGEVAVAGGLRAAVAIERDDRGVPTLSGESRADLAFATGFVHAQERFFQMDLLRRRAAGELAELFGAAALPADREARVHRFRERARTVLAALPATQRGLLRAYAAGVNTGLTRLGARPPEYLLLVAAPRRWAEEDALLVGYAMYLVLQRAAVVRESALGVLREVWGEPAYAFLAPRGTEWDAALDDGRMPDPPLPAAQVVDVRHRSTAAPILAGVAARRPGAGSNAWAVAGGLADGGALLANDMHLPLRIPNTWYRLSLVLHGRRVTGITLPGTPAVLAGSNGHLAWGFTNSYIDVADLVVVETAPGDAAAYRIADGTRRFVDHSETIAVRGGGHETLHVRETVWGPLVDRDHRGRPRALRWVAHDVRAMNFALMDMENADDVHAGIAVAHRAGMPTQNVLLADADGAVAWTLAGPVPVPGPGDGRRPRSGGETAAHPAWLDPAQVPVVAQPEGGRLWSANARALSGAASALLGDGGYYLGARARQIRDALRAREHFTERDMLALQLDDRALFLARWRAVLDETLSRLGDEARGAASWVRDAEHAAVDSVGYRLVREFHDAVAARAFAPFVAACMQADPGFDWGSVPQTEGPLWRLVSERPAHMLDPRFASWQALLDDAAASVVDSARAAPGGLARYTWGARNRVSIRHALGRAFPPLGFWLDLTPQALPGDRHMPRVQTPRFGASMRMVVAPGREQLGLFLMPGGQSGHPLSPHYRDAQPDWAAGRPAPFLPGPAQHVVTLRPANG